MIAPEMTPHALRALHRLIVHAKDQAYQATAMNLGDFLNDVESLPELLADEADRTEEFADLLDGISDTHPGCQYVADEYHRAESLLKA